MSMPPVEAPDSITCAGCGSETSKSLVATENYSCPRCSLELAHLDTAPNGSVRGVIGWLRTPGDVVNERYRVSKLLGRGGFAVTYLVEDMLLSGKRRALKEVPEILFDEGEAEILSRIDHPAVPDITDRCSLEGMIYLVLEFGGSRSLESVRRDEGGKIPLAKLQEWVEQLCDVLGYLHTQDPPIVHRDLKPDNILLDERDRVMIIDFGIAKQDGDDAVTRTIARAVSHGFSPPEQALGTGTDQRSDVYALGATVYALLTGVVPPAAHERVTGKEIVPPASLNPEIGPDLEAVLLQSMSLNILKRFESIGDFRSAFAGGSVGAPAEADAGGRTVTIDSIATAAPPSTGTPVVSTSGAVVSSSGKVVSTGASLPSTPMQAPVAAPAARSGPSPLVLIGAAAAVLVAVGAAAFFFLGGDETGETAPVGTPPIAAQPDPSATSVAGAAGTAPGAAGSAGSALAPDPLAATTAVDPLDATASAGSGVEDSGVSAMDALLQDMDTSTPEPQARTPSAEGKISKAAPAPPPARREPKKSAGSWGKGKITTKKVQRK